MKKTNNAQLVLIASMVVFGTIGLFVKNIPLSSGEIALYRAVMAAIFCGGFLIATKQKIDFKEIKNELILLLISGMAMGINWILLFEAYKYTTISIATLSYYFAPVIVTVACPFLFGEKTGFKQWLCFGMSTVGLVIMTGLGNTGEKNSHLTGILFGLGAAVFYATVMLMNKKIKKCAGIPRAFLQFLASIVVVFPYVMFTDGINVASLNVTGWGLLLTVGIVHTGITYCMYFSALKELPGQKAAILSYIDPLVAVLISFFAEEVMSPRQIIGGLIILGFTIWNELPEKKAKA